MRPLLAGLMTIALLAAACSGDDGDGNDDEGDAGNDDTPDADRGTSAAPASLTFTIDGIAGGGNVPVEFTCDGANDTPAVTIDEVPAGVEELVLIVDDPDAPTADPYVHWVVYGIGPGGGVVDDGDDALTYGVNDRGSDTWFGPCPPLGDGPHTYRWKLFGLSATTGLAPGLDGRAVEAAIAGAVVAEALVAASYERAG